MSPPTHALDLIPLWAVFLLIVGTLLLATELGFRVGRSWQHRAPDKDTAIGPMVAAVLGLVGFLLAFMVSMAADRYNARRGLVLAEANTIGTAYLRAGYLPEPYGSESRDLLRQYLDVRLIALDVSRAAESIALSEEIQVELWHRADAMVEQTGGSDVYALYVESLNELVELHSQREIAAFYARIPTTLVLALYGFSLMGFFILGFANSYDGRRSVVALIALVLVFGSVLYLIVDLDRSREGMFQVSYQPLIGLEERMQP
jgi:hypothetical protein